MLVKSEIESRLLDRGLVGLHRGLQLRHGRLLVLEALPRLEAGADQLAVAGQVTLCALQLRLVLAALASAWSSVA